MVICPLCNAGIDVEEDELDEGDVVTCEECTTEHRVIGLDPLELEPLEEEDEEDDEDSLDLDDEDGDGRWR